MGFTLLTSDRVFPDFISAVAVGDNKKHSRKKLRPKDELKLCRETDGGVNSISAADGLRLIDIGLGLWGHLYSRGSFLKRGATRIWNHNERVIVWSSL